MFTTERTERRDISDTGGGGTDAKQGTERLATAGRNPLSALIHRN